MTWGQAEDLIFRIVSRALLPLTVLFLIAMLCCFAVFGQAEPAFQFLKASFLISAIVTVVCAFAGIFCLSMEEER